MTTTDHTSNLKSNLEAMERQLKACRERGSWLEYILTAHNAIAIVQHLQVLGAEINPVQPEGMK